MASPSHHQVAAPPAAQPALPDDLLEDIFVRLDSAGDLARASAACTTLRRVVSSRLFRLRFRSLHTAPILGLLLGDSFRPAESPHRAAPAARALAQAADFTFSFVPDPSSWQICDASDGRFLLSSRKTGTTPAAFQDLVVCDPFHRRCARIPPIPDDLITRTRIDWLCGFLFLAPACGEESSFRVVWMVKLKQEGKLIAFVFSSDTGKWRQLTFDGLMGIGAITGRYYTRISFFYQTSGSFEDVLMFDTRKMEFSVVRIPVHHCRQPAIVEAGEGRLGLLTLGDGMLDLYCKAWQGNGAGAEEWQHEKTIPLPDADSLSYRFRGAGSGYLILETIPRDLRELVSSSQEVPQIQYFTLELKTLQMERLCVSNKLVAFPYLYASFLPPLSMPSV